MLREPLLVFFLAESGEDFLDESGTVILILVDDALGVQSNLRSHSQQIVDFIHRRPPFCFCPLLRNGRLRFAKLIEVFLVYLNQRLAQGSQLRREKQSFMHCLHFHFRNYCGRHCLQFKEMALDFVEVEGVDGLHELFPLCLFFDIHAHASEFGGDVDGRSVAEGLEEVGDFGTHIMQWGDIAQLTQDLSPIMPKAQTALFLAVLLCAAAVQAFSFKQLSDSCSNFDNENACRGQQTDNDPSWANRAFQTPPRGDPLWRESYQDYNILVGYARTVYTSSGANVTVITRVNPAYSSLTLKYFFGDSSSDSNSFFVSNSFKNLLTVRVEAYDGGEKKATLKIDDVDFTWNHPTVNQPSNFKNGQKGAIIEMFGWPYDDIAEECEMIGKAGYLGVKVFPPSEAILDFEHPENGELNPWYWVYQPVSYKLHSRMGTPEQLRSMINTCREKGVRVYADAVVNHMVGNGNDMFPSHCSGGNYWGNKNSSGGSPFWSQGFAYENWRVTNSRPGMELPAVPYGPNDFHCARSLNSWTDGFILNYGWLVNLADLNTETDYVRQRIADYFTALLGMGFSGFRIDAAKHISPANLAAIFARFKANMGGRLPDDFITYLQVIIGGEKDLLMCQDNSYNFGKSFANLMRQQGLSDDDINKVKIWESDYPKEFPLCGWPIPPERYAIQLDCHDDQFPGSSSRDMGDTGSVLVKEKNVDRHRNFNIQMFTRTDANWQIKLLLSSYTFIESSGAYGFPDGHSDCTRCATPECRQKCTKSMPYSKAHRSDVCGYTCIENGSWQQGVYTRVHRDFRTIKAVRQFMGLNSNVSPRDVGLPDNCS